MKSGGVVGGGTQGASGTGSVDDVETRSTRSVDLTKKGRTAGRGRGRRSSEGTVKSGRTWVP